MYAYTKLTKGIRTKLKAKNDKTRVHIYKSFPFFISIKEEPLLQKGPTGVVSYTNIKRKHPIQGQWTRDTKTFGEWHYIEHGGNTYQARTVEREVIYSGGKLGNDPKTDDALPLCRAMSIR